MPFVQGSAIEKARKDSLEYKADTICQSIQAQYEDTLNVIATFEDHVLAFNSDGKLRNISFSFN
ncbi:MAG: hypothetical protein JW704_06685, partial [Anaerolineaceae bacterium]|nr:hypothetical protein [Anaerolineaceae bacterium]